MIDLKKIKAHLEAILAEGCNTEELRDTTPVRDPAELACANEAKELAAGRLTKWGLRMELVKIALDRIARDTYGTCLNCGDLIAEKRLVGDSISGEQLPAAANPEAPLCIRCQKDLEGGELLRSTYLAELRRCASHRPIAQ